MHDRLNRCVRRAVLGDGIDSAMLGRTGDGCATVAHSSGTCCLMATSDGAGARCAMHGCVGCDTTMAKAKNTLGFRRVRTDGAGVRCTVRGTGGVHFARRLALSNTRRGGRDDEVRWCDGDNPMCGVPWSGDARNEQRERGEAESCGRCWHWAANAPLRTRSLASHPNTWRRGSWAWAGHDGRGKARVP